jgi:RHS repeat-associated protein
VEKSILCYSQESRWVGWTLTEYVWLGDLPVAVFKPDPANALNPPLVYFIHTDHLNTPRVVMDTSNVMRWSWFAEPFGTTKADSNPSGAGSFAFSLRFPGQVFDAESGMHYNLNRDYIPGVGRYAQSDPIGLAGGINTYLYVKGNPLRYIDPAGLGPWDKLYGFGKEFWRWFHKDDPELFRELKDPNTGQIPKEVAQPYYDDWKKRKEGGFADPTLLEGLLPWGLTPSELAPGTLWGPGTPYPTPQDYDNARGKQSCP